MHRTVLLTVSLPLALLPLVACSSTSSSTQRDVQAETGDGWVSASPILQQQIDDEAKRLPWTHGFDRLEQIRWFASVGEPAYTTLLELAQDPRDDVAAASLAALGATLDNRLVPSVQRLNWSQERIAGDLGLERARTLVRLGDWSALPRLIEGLRDPRLYTRSLCLDALTEATKETQGFDPKSSEDAREAAVKRWERWWLARSGDAMIGAGGR